MHVSHHLPPPPELNSRPQTRKTPDEDVKGAYSHLTGLSDENRRKGSKRQPQDQNEPDQPPQPTTSGLIRAKPRPVASGKPAPFLAVTSVTQFWTELVMASKDEDANAASLPLAAPAQQTGPSLLDLFAKAVK
jgi:hypothetical protein